MLINAPATSVSLDVQVLQDDGSPATGLLAATFPALSYSLGSRAAAVSFPALSDLPLITSGFVAGGVKERLEGWYRLDAPDAMFASAASQPRIIGDEPGKHLLHEPIFMSQGLTVDQQEQLDDIADATGLISGGKIIARSPVLDNGQHLVLVKGDDYNVASGQPLEWTDTQGLWPDLAGAAITLVLSEKNAAGGAGSAVLTKAGSVVTASGNNKKVRVEPLAALTGLLTPGSRINLLSLRAVLATGETVTLAAGENTVLDAP